MSPIRHAYDVTSGDEPRRLFDVKFKRWHEPIAIYARNRSAAIYGAAKKMAEAGYSRDAMVTAWHGTEWARRNQTDLPVCK